MVFWLLLLLSIGKDLFSMKVHPSPRRTIFFFILKPSPNFVTVYQLLANNFCHYLNTTIPTITLKHYRRNEGDSYNDRYHSTRNHKKRSLKQTASSRIWTLVTVFISNHDNRYTKSTSRVCNPNVVKTANYNEIFIGVTHLEISYLRNEGQFVIEWQFCQLYV